MKSKLMIFGMILALGLVFAGPQNAQAGTWATVSIDQIGMGTTVVNLVLTHEATSPSFTKQWFRIVPEVKNQILAIALTAISLDKNLKVYIDDDGETIIKVRLDN